MSLEELAESILDAVLLKNRRLNGKDILELYYQGTTYKEMVKLSHWPSSSINALVQREKEQGRLETRKDWKNSNKGEAYNHGK